MANTWHEQAKQMWNHNATFWNSKSQNMWDEGSRKSIVPFFRKYVDPNTKVLDLGCGDGYGSYKLWKEGYDVTGVDLSDEMVKLCQNRLSEKQERLSFKQADMMKLPFEDQSFDALMAINALEWAEVPIKAFKEISRVVKTGGFLCIGVLGPTAAPRSNSYNRLYGDDVIMNTMMPWEFEQLAKEQSYEVLEQEKVYKRGVDLKHVGSLSEDMQQALTFITVFMLKK